MTRAALVIIALAALAAACQAGAEGPRYVSPEDHFSMAELPGWTASRSRDSVVFRPSADDAGGVTIAIRSVPTTGQWIEDRTVDLVIPATERVLRALPAAEVSAPRGLERLDILGATFDLSFVPPGGGGERFERTHKVLVGRTRVLHVALTWPESVRPGDAARAFETVISTIREEG